MASLTFEDCKKVFLDTTVILDLLHPHSKEERVKCVKALLEILCKVKKSKFYISAITIAEIVDVVKFERIDAIESGIIEEILESLQGKDIEVVSYSEPVALMQRSLFSHLSDKKSINDFLARNNALGNNWASCREWLSKDFMIAATAKYINADITFTGDKKTFIPVAKEIALPCIGTYFENFNLNRGGDKIYGFKTHIPMFVKPATKKPELKGGLFENLM
ncbi:PIN domain-containing protein [Larkinella terrae]|uniref:PIN domain-containing protein n=1 Tax=Larkinella terrae TaxID=2025311 RepID=A0A7K0EIR3_9BACT|nr:PIN domain-containing protein [Larkinella terrae]MRS61739.1 PIN domain-containing protein [Larkinella terrae]